MKAFINNILGKIRVTHNNSDNAPSENKYNASNVSHQNAMKWFEKRKHNYEELISAIIPYVTEDSVIFDIGANIGYFSLLLTEKFNFSGSLFLFEPVDHLAELCKTTFQNARFKVQINNYGLSDANAEEEIFIAGDGNLGWNTLISQKATSDMSKTLVKLRVFDDCSIDTIPTFIKIDVEGAEFKVLRGMMGSLTKWKPLPVIICEIGWGKNHPEWEEEKQVFADLVKFGYKICNLDGLPIDINLLTGTIDVIFIPADK